MLKNFQGYSVQFSRSVMSDSLWPHEPQHTRPPCPSPTPGVHPNPCLLSQWCHPTISSSVIPFSCPQSFSASGSFPVSQLFASGGQSIGVSASTSVLPMNTQEWSPLGWTGWISLQSKGLSRVFFNTSSKASILQHSAFFIESFLPPFYCGSNPLLMVLTAWWVERHSGLLGRVEWCSHCVPSSSYEGLCPSVFCSFLSSGHVLNPDPSFWVA